ncbi:unnamed protein product [Echinostoma caproni]|uniref:Rhodopsin n=1 Tax=Echinostoma caproni TaxID=27848 RepID=A0A183AFB1_9TREM|nr:unnamed protein product [Echinostoma caproni]
MYALNFITYGVDSFFLFALYKVHGGYLNSPAVTQPPVNQPPPPQMVQQPSYPPSAYTNSAYDGQPVPEQSGYAYQ